MALSVTKGIALLPPYDCISSASPASEFAATLYSSCANEYQYSESGGVENGNPTTKPWTTVAPLATHKLGPKANQGAINAGLRALDRSGKPCRKWERTGFKVKSFTGVAWQLPSWRAPRTTTVNVSDETKEASTPRLKANNSSSAVDSEKSHSGGDVDMATLASNTASSPILGIAIPA